MKEIEIIKADGRSESFDESKLIRSLKAARASDEDINNVKMGLDTHLKHGMSTKEIHDLAFQLLRGRSGAKAARYKLKRAIMELGPTGFPFEKYVGALYQHEGFKTTVGTQVKGRCVNHEVDVIAESEDKHLMIECKFHSEPGRRCDVKIPLYINSRFQDVADQWWKLTGHQEKKHYGSVVTNTRFTSDAIKYGSCVGLKLISWDYPKQGSLKQKIDRSGLHPITCLTGLTKHEKSKLLDRNIVLCRDIHNHIAVLQQIGIRGERLQSIKDEIRQLCI